MNLDIEITGHTALLMNRFSDGSEVAVSSGHRPSTVGHRGTPREQAEKTAYQDEKGYLYVPQQNLFACLINAGKFHKVGKSKVTTMKSSLVPAGIAMLDGLVLPILSPKSNKGLKQFEVDSRRVVIPSTGGAVMRHRARVDDWRIRFSIEVDLELFSPDFVRTLVDDAGKKIGLGDYRPERKGPFGKFKVTSWAVQKAPKTKKARKSA
jgi:hypothetical protein